MVAVKAGGRENQNCRCAERERLNRVHGKVVMNRSAGSFNGRLAPLSGQHRSAVDADFFEINGPVLPEDVVLASIFMSGHNPSPAAIQTSSMTAKL